jgi:maleate isomerase
VTSNDNWGWQGRIGLFIVGNEAVPEAEWWAMAPRGVSVHAARVTARAPWARWREGGKGVEPEEDLIRGCRQFSAMRLSAVVVAHSSSSIVGGKGWDEAAVASLAPLLGAGTFITTNGLDTQAALRACGVRRPFLVLPPWFNDETVAAGIRYYADHGFEPAGASFATIRAASGATCRRPSSTATVLASSRRSSHSTRRSRRRVRWAPMAC